MKFVKKFESFINEGGAAQPEVKPARPTTKPDTKPSIRPTKPGGIPSQDPRPSIAPDPTRAEKKKGKAEEATAEEVAERFINLMVEKGEDLKKYVEVK